jgi:hypothetical protein
MAHRVAGHSSASGILLPKQAGVTASSSCRAMPCVKTSMGRRVSGRFRLASGTAEAPRYIGPVLRPPFIPPCLPTLRDRLPKGEGSTRSRRLPHAGAQDRRARHLIHPQRRGLDEPPSASRCQPHHVAVLLRFPWERMPRTMLMRREGRRPLAGVSVHLEQGNREGTSEVNRKEFIEGD